MTRFDTIIFDLDDTLIDEAPNVIQGYRAAARYAARCYTVDSDMFADVAPLAAREAWWEPDWLGPVTDKYGLSAWDGLSEQFPGPGRQLQRLRTWLPKYRHEAWRSAFARCGVRADPHVVAETARVFIAARHAGRVRLQPGASRLLDQFCDRNLAVLTNGPADGQESKVHRSGVGRRVKAVVASTAAGIGKPSPRLVSRCRKELGARSRKVLIVGDSLDHDIHLATECGLPAVWIDRDGSGSAPAGVVTVRDTAAVAAAIRRLERSR